MQEKLNDFVFARNIYSLPVANDTSSTFSFDVTVKNGSFIINGNTAPALKLLAGCSYSFFMAPATFATFPLTIGTAVGTPFKTSNTIELTLVKIVFTIPFSYPSSFVYYSSNSAVKGNTILPLIPTYYTVEPKLGFFFINDQQQPVLTIYRGTTYTFTAKNSDLINFPFSIGRTIKTSYSGVVTKKGSYWTTWTVTVTNTITSLVYYNAFAPAMGASINVVDAPSPRRSLITSDTIPVKHLQQTGYTLPPCSGSYKNPRQALQMSLYCLVANLPTTFSPARAQQPYKTSTICNKIISAYLPTQLYSPSVYPPNRICNSNPYNGVDACTVNAPIRLSSDGTCRAYCGGFIGCFTDSTKHYAMLT